MDWEGVREGNSSPRVENKSSQTSQKEGTGREWLSFMENLEVFQTKHWQRAKWGRSSSRKKLQARSLLQVGWKVKVLVALFCLTLCDPMNCSQPGSSVHGILQARIPEWVVILFSRGSSWTRDWVRSLLHCGQNLYCMSHKGSQQIHTYIYTYIPWLSRESDQ